MLQKLYLDTAGNNIFGHRVHIEMIQSLTWITDCEVVRLCNKVSYSGQNDIIL